VSVSGTTLTLTIPDYVDYTQNTTGTPPGTPRTPTVASGSPSWGLPTATVTYTSTPITVAYSLNGQQLIRTQGSVQAVISNDIDNFQPAYTIGTPPTVTMTITFAPRFNRSNSATARAGTTVYSTIVKRN
jgi:hypothetical protein